MKERGILFTPENIRAIRRKDNPKTQTRRVMNPQPRTGQIWGDVEESETYPGEWFQWYEGGTKVPIKPCPQGQIGDRLYIKEGVIVHASIPQLCGYYMDGARATEQWEKRLTAMFMPKYAARTWLEITDVRVEKLQDISEEDAKAEGCEPESVTANDIADLNISDASPIIKEMARILGPGKITTRAKFISLWDSINKTKHPWSQNDWVWAISFRKL